MGGGEEGGGGGVGESVEDERGYFESGEDASVGKSLILRGQLLCQMCPCQRGDYWAADEKAPGGEAAEPWPTSNSNRTVSRR